MQKIGIDTVGFYTSHYYFDIEDFAKARQLDVNKFHIGLGQYKMGIPAPDEDVVSMGANAAKEALQDININDIGALLFATESGIDQSKSAGVYVHTLLNLPAHCRIMELKQACYAATAALQIAVSLVQRQPNKKILLISSDVARYAMHSPAESSQGCGAIAMVISTEPRVLEIEPAYGVYTEDVMDFWRPNYKEVPFVEGKHSSLVYLRVLEKVWDHFCSETDVAFQDIQHFCYHSPLPRLVEKAHKLLKRINGKSDLLETHIREELDAALKYAHDLGNTYTGALYISLLSLLTHTKENLSGHRVGFYSYGSGCVGEFFTGIIQDNYRKMIDTSVHKEMMQSREPLSYEDYEKFYQFALPQTGEEFFTPRFQTGAYRLKGINNHQRLYEVAQKKNKKKKLVTDPKTKEIFVVKAVSPGKLILSGEHSVVYGGPALAMAVDRFAETTISPQLSKMISFNLLSFRYKDSFTIQTLREIKHRLTHQYQRFLHGEIGIKEVLQTPFELTQFAFISLLDHVNSKIIDGLNIQTSSTIPVGCGMGSSAASVLSVLYAIARFCKLNLEKDRFLRLGYEAEKLQHGYPSGLDLYTSLHGGCVYFQNGQAALRPLPANPFFLVNTGTPDATTGEAVTFVKERFSEQKALWKSFEEVTHAMDRAFQSNDCAALQLAVRENHRLLTHIGVVPERVQQFIEAIEKAGAAAKVCGAGSVKGDRSGVVMMMADDQERVSSICQRFGYTLETVQGTLQGVESLYD
ncbi:MAG: hydroxymethylglutaryl-CoA synthase [Pseudomonadota bacterium]|nr:hydroxymethylglutaryl-CoA synthase [Gammaproteobacteria bacterium]